jgi:cell division septum initiation protein DivIVA
MFNDFDHQTVFRRKPLSVKRFPAAVPVLLACLAAGGCMVTGSKYEMKTREADTLRDAFAAVSKEKTILESKNEALNKQLADQKEAVASLSARVRNQEEEIRRVSEELAVARKNYEGTRITREQFINELLEKEKATGKRTQELGAKAHACELSLESIRKEAAVREAELAGLRLSIGKPGESEAMKRERDILVGRVERLTEERKQEDKRRDERFTALAEFIGKISAEVVLTPLGPAMHMHIPDKILLVKGKSSLSDAGRGIVAEVGKAAAEFPSSSILLSAGGKKLGEEIRDSLVNGAKIPPGRILLKPGDREKGAELTLLIP